MIHGRILISKNDSFIFLNFSTRFLGQKHESTRRINLNLKTQMANVKTTTQNLKLGRQKQNYNLEIQILNPKVFLVLSFNM